MDALPGVRINALEMEWKGKWWGGIQTIVKAQDEEDWCNSEEKKSQSHSPS